MKNRFAIVCICLLVIGFGINEVKAAQKEKTKKVIYNAAGEVQSYYTYQYNDFGKDKKLHFTPSDKLMSYFTYDYDTEGKRLKKTEFDASDKAVGYTTYEYDNKGVRTEKAFTATANCARSMFMNTMQLARGRKGTSMHLKRFLTLM